MRHRALAHGGEPGTPGAPLGVVAPLARGGGPVTRLREACGYFAFAVAVFVLLFVVVTLVQAAFAPVCP